MQQKTGRAVQFELLADARASLLAWLERRGGTLVDYVFSSRVDPADHLSTRQYARLVDEWVSGVGLRREEYGTHSLRRTKASIIYKATGNLRAIQILLGLTKIENTVRYRGVDVEDAPTLAEGTEIRTTRLLPTVRSRTATRQTRTASQANAHPDANMRLGSQTVELW